MVTVAKEAGQTAKTIVWENVKKMYAQLWAKSRGNMITIVNQSVLPELMNMSIPIGTGGIPVWMPASAAAGQPYDMLLGRPLILAEQSQTIGTKGDIYLADLSQYLIIDKPLQSAYSIHVKFTTDETTFRIVWRIDGQPLWNNSLTPYKDASTSQPLSPFICLATRS